MATVEIIEAMALVSTGKKITDTQKTKLKTFFQTERAKLNSGKPADEDFLMFMPNVIKSNLFHHLPKPSESDIGYKQFYLKVEGFRKSSMLAHRFDILGSREYHEMSLNLHGGVPDNMVSEMQVSFSAFLTSENPAQNNVDQHVLEQAFSDVKQTMTTATDVGAKPDLGQSQVYLMPVSVRSEDGFHAIGVAFNGDICLVCDRGREEGEDGVDVYLSETKRADMVKSQRDMSDERHVATMRDLLETNSIFEQENLSDLEGVQTRVSQKLGKKLIYHIPLQSQYGENCSWTSCAKMQVLSALFCRFYQNSQQPDSVKRCQEAHTKAKQYYHAWSNWDKRADLKAYIDYFKLPENQNFGPDVILLNQIYLRSKYRAKNTDIAEMLVATGHINEKNQALAKAHTISLAETMLADEIPEEFLEAQPAVCKRLAEQFVDVLIYAGKAKVDEIFEKLEEAFKNGILDERLNQLMDLEIKKIHTSSLGEATKPGKVKGK